MHCQKLQYALNILSQIWVYTENEGIKRHLLELSSLHSVLLKFNKKSKMVHEYSVTHLSLIIYLNFCLSFFQSARVMEGGYICVDNSGLLQKVYKLTEEKHDVAHDELIKQVSC